MSQLQDGEREADAEMLRNMLRVGADRASAARFEAALEALERLVVERDAAERALKLAYPYVKDVFAEETLPDLRAVVEADLVVIAVAVRAATRPDLSVGRPLAGLPAWCPCCGGLGWIKEQPGSPPKSCPEVSCCLDGGET